MKIRQAFLILISLATMHLAIPVGAAERVALVIGVTQYPADGRFPILPNPGNDAELISETLRKADFTVTTLTDRPGATAPTSRSALRAAVLKFSEAIKPGGAAVFYFAGHGIQWQGENYLMGSNARLQVQAELDAEAITAKFVIETMRSRKPQAAFAFLDCCRKTPPKSWLNPTGRDSTGHGLAQMASGGMAILFAAEPDDTAEDGGALGLKNSPFALALSHHLLTGKSHRDAFAEVRNEVVEVTTPLRPGRPQWPWVSENILKAFYFGNSPERPPPPPPPPRNPLAGASKANPYVNSLGMKFVPVPISGGPTDGKRVLFCIWETRMQDYQEFAQATNRQWEKPALQPKHPAVRVSWNDARKFCEWLSAKEEGLRYRLPSDHEWSCAVGIGGDEEAATSPDEKHRVVRKFPWGNSTSAPDGVGNYAPSLGIDKFPETAPVESFNANRYGLFDLGGNVWEWCDDRYSRGDPAANADRVFRGAGWKDAVWLESSARYKDEPGYTSDSLGFRVVVTDR